MLAVLTVLLLCAAAPVAAQTTEPVSGYVIDLRGATSGLPKESSFFPGLPPEALVPARGFGFEAAGHVYLFKLGPSRVGIGASYLRARGTSPGIVATFSTVAPQLSLNFGSRDGWSYLSAGLGRAWMRTRVEDESGVTTGDSGELTSTNFGGGARWFLARHVGVGFDVRFHRLSGATRAMVVGATVGFSVR